ncbi:MAG: 50S ribosomal protein L1 [Dehalococcoidia bacterium]
MAKQSKRYIEISKEIKSTEYNPDEAVNLAKELSKVKFDEAVELHISTNADPKQADQNLREVAELPHGTGKDVRVLVFVQGDDARIAKEAGADYISDDELVKKIEDGWADFDVAIATPDQMPKIGKLGRYLGRKGLMPNPRTGTVVQPENITSAIDSAKKGRAEIKLDKGANIHVRIGTVKFESTQLLDNLSSVYSTIMRARPDSIKGSLVKNVSMCTTMGPSIKLSQTELEKLASGSK